MIALVTDRFALALFAILSLAHQVHGQNLGDWEFCSSSSQCRNGCCSSRYSDDGKLKCTPLNGGFRSDICVSGSGSGSSQLGDWAFCSTSSQCQNGCCSSRYSNDGELKCTPLNGGFRSDICVSGGGGGGGGGSSLYSGSGGGTYYYDVSGRTCNGDPRYAENDGYPTCTSFNPSFWKTVQQYGTNNMVAIDRTLLSTPEGRARYCGKQIKVYRNGAEVSSGPFFVFDGCQACEGGTRIDFSVSALDSISGGTACRDGVVSGISWDVIDNQIIPFVP